ncbi:hypothetical protein JCM6882_001834 [Rhodosporidiobolus microsporus]
MLLNVPFELLREVTVHLDQPSLASLARTSKLLRPTAVEQLYSSPVVRGQRSANAWTRTWDGWVSPFTAVKVKKGELRVPAVKELTFQAVEDEPMKVANLRGCFEVGVFDKLTSFTARGCKMDMAFLAHLLGPRSPCRVNLVSLTLTSLPQLISGFTDTSDLTAPFLFDFFHFLPFLPFFSHCTKDEEEAIALERSAKPWQEHPMPSSLLFTDLFGLPQALRTRLSTEFDYFADKFRFSLYPFSPLVHQFVYEQSATAFPFANLVSLDYRLNLNLGEEAFVFLGTNLFPNLLHVILRGAFTSLWVSGAPVVEYPLIRIARYSVYHSSSAEPLKPAELVEVPGLVVVEMSLTAAAFDPLDFFSTRDDSYRPTTRRDDDYPSRRPDSDDHHRSGFNTKLLAILLPTLATFFVLLLVAFLCFRVQRVKKRVELERVEREIREIEREREDEERERGRARERDWDVVVAARGGGSGDYGGDRCRNADSDSDDGKVEWRYPPLPPPPVYSHHRREDPFDHRRHSHFPHHPHHHHEHHHRCRCKRRHRCKCGRCECRR